MIQLGISAVAAGATGLEKALGTLSGAAKSDDAKLQKVAKDFESVFLQKLADTMRQSIPDSGLFDSSAMQQTQAIFWSQLSEELGKQGGLGLWKQIYHQLKTSAPSTPAAGATEVKP